VVAVVVHAALLLVAPGAPAAADGFVFEPNVGHAPATASFVARGHGYRVLVGPSGSMVTVRTPAVGEESRRATITLTPLGARPVEPVPAAAASGQASYFLGSDPAAWRSGVPVHERVRQPGLYPGVDLVYYGRDRRLEWDLVLEPSADPGRIRMAVAVTIDGAPAHLVLEDGGDLVARRGPAEIRLHRPVAFQDIDGVRRGVDARYVLEPRPAAGGAAVVAFALGAYDPTRVLVIDPVVDYAGHIGGNGADAGTAITADAAGNLYVTGLTESADGASTDAFVVKYGPDGSGPLYTAYLGGSGDDTGLAIAVDGAGRAHVTGATDAADFPTVNGFQPTAPGAGDAFVARLSADGATLLYATYLGGTGPDAGRGIALDSGGRPHVTGITASADFPTSAALQTVGRATDAFVAKIDPGAVGEASLVWATYLGGTDADEGQAIAVDLDGNAYVAGVTASGDFPVVGAYQPGPGGGTDAFLAKLNAAGTALLYSTYLGGTGDDAAHGVAVDELATAYVAGGTASGNFPVKFPFQATRAGTAGRDAFLVRLNPSVTGRNSLLYATYAGGTGDDVGHAVAVNEEGHAYVAGATTSADFPARNAVGPPGGGRDAFVVKVNPLVASDSLLYATPLGGSGDDEAFGIALDDAGQAYVTGSTQSSDFPRIGLTAPLAGPQDGFIARLAQADLIVATFSAPTSAGAGEPFSVTDATRNRGDVGAAATATAFFLSVDNRLGADDVMIGRRDVPELEPGAEDTAVTELTVPAGTAPGTYFLFARADDDRAVDEGLESNNRSRRTLVVGPDLVIASFTLTTSGATITATDTIRNSGAGTTGPTTARFYLSPTATLAAGAPVIGHRAVPALKSGESSPATTPLALPAGTSPGSYVVVMRADADDAAAELSETNNEASRPLGVGIDLAVSSLSAASTAVAGGSFTITDTTASQGIAGAPASVTRYHLSKDTILDPATDVVLGQRAVPALEPGMADTGSVTVTIPATTTGGSYFVLAVADAENVAVESNETNNVRSRAVRTGPDLVITAVGAPVGARPGGAITVTDTTKNQAGEPSPASTTSFFLSRDTTLDPTDRLLGSRSVIALDARKTRAGTATVTIPEDVTAGPYHVIAKADGPDAIAEADETNNTLASTPIAVGTDLAVSALTAAVNGLVVAVTDATANRGGAPAAESVVRFYVSGDATVDAGDAVLGERLVPALDGGATSTATTSLPIPAGLAAGSYHLIAVADAGQAVAEANEGNNTTVLASMVLGPDLVVTGFTTKAFATAGTTITLTETTSNAGSHPTLASVTQFYLSTDATWDPGDRLLASRAVGALAPGQGSTVSTKPVLPADVPTGRYFVIARADGGEAVSEASETNNAVAVPVAVGVDLTVTVTVPAVGAPGATLSISDRTTNLGGGTSAPSVTRLYLSAIPTLDGSAVPIGSRQVPSIGPGASSSGTTQVTIPATTSVGAYHVIAQADAGAVLGEGLEDNNVGAAPITLGSDLIVTKLSVPNTGAAGVPITVGDTTKNAAGGTTPSTAIRFHLSRDAVLDDTDRVLGTRTVPPLAAGATSSASTPFIVPADLEAGIWKVIAVADADGAVTEVNEANNVTLSNVSVAIGPDLQLTGLSLPSAAGASVTLTETTANKGAGGAAGSTTRYVLTTDGTVRPGDLVAGSRLVPPLGPNETSTAVITLTFPPGLAGTFVLAAVADGDGTVGEVDETNNVRRSTLRIGADLTLTRLTAPASAGPGRTITVEDTVANNGLVATDPSTTRLYVSATKSVDASSRLLGSRSVPALAPGATSPGATVVTLPLDVAIGTQQIIAVADADATVPERDETNNTMARDVIIGPDLTVTSASTSASAVAGAIISVTATVKNLTGDTAPPSVASFYLSPDQQPTGLLLGTRDVMQLGPRSGSLGTTKLTIPPGTPPGSYFLVVHADGPDAIRELVETNNTFAIPFTLLP
jgi:subtilase family serine protease